MTRLFPLMSMEYTPFGRERSIHMLREHGIEMTENPAEADVLVTKKYSRLLLKNIRRFGWRHMFRAGRPILVWTREPWHCKITQPKLAGRFGFPDVHVMNVFNRNVFLSNYGQYGFRIDHRLSRAIEAPREKAHSVVALTTFISRPRKRKLMIRGRDVDLSAFRQELIVTGHKMGLVDVYGRGWPESMKKCETRGPDDEAEKERILQDYHFNICMENADFEHHCCEKIWDSIKGACLPIYQGTNGTIYEDFPRGSFVDVNDFESPTELFGYVRAMSAEEYLSRMNMCIDAFNAIYDRADREERRREELLKVVEKVKEIVRR